MLTMPQTKFQPHPQYYQPRRPFSHKVNFTYLRVKRIYPPQCVFTFARPILKSKKLPVFLTPLAGESNPKASRMLCPLAQHELQFSLNAAHELCSCVLLHDNLPCSPGWPQTPNPFVPASQVLGFQVCLAGPLHLLPHSVCGRDRKLSACDKGSHEFFSLLDIF